MVTLTINNVVVATKDITLAGGASQKVTFTTVKDIAGTYAVNVSGRVSTFTVKPPPAPAIFTVSTLTISPTEVDIGERVTISILVTNIGEVEGSYEAVLKIDGAPVATKVVTLGAGKSTKVVFPVTRDVAATYQVEVDGQVGQFTVVKHVFPWWWIVVGVVVIGLVVFFVIRRRRF